MEYYHFRIDYFDKKIDGYQTRWHHDASADFIEQYVVPFLKSSDFIFNGQRIVGTAVEALKVYQSSAKYQDCLIRYNAEHRFHFVGDFLTCTDYFTDITADCIVRFDGVVKNDAVEKAKQKEKTPIVLISHREKDKEFVEPLVDLLYGMGLGSSNLFCSSIPGLWIPKGNIYDFLKDKFVKNKIYVLFVHSPRFYESPVCLNEMGAAWAVKAEYFSLLTKDMTYDKMNGVVNSQDICIKVDDPNAGARLIDLRNDILNFLQLPPVEEHKWNRMSQAFLKAVNDIDYSQKGDVQNKSEQVEQSDQKAQKSVNVAKALTYFMQASKEEDLGRKIELYKKSIEINPDDAKAYNNRGNAYRKKGEYDKAIADYTKATEINPNYADAYVNRGNAYTKNNDYSQAIADYTKAIEINPDDAEASNNRGIANMIIAKKLEADGKTAEALELYKAAVKDFDKFLELWTKDDVVRKIAIRLKQECEEAIERLEGKQE